MFAIVRAGGRQEKVSVGDVLIIDKVSGKPGDSIDLTPLLVVDGSTVTSDAAKLAKVTVKDSNGDDVDLSAFTAGVAQTPAEAAE